MKPDTDRQMDGWIFLGYLRKCSIVPDIAMVRETVADISDLPFLHILLDWVQRILGADLQYKERISWYNNPLGPSTDQIQTSPFYLWPFMGRTVWRK